MASVSNSLSYSVLAGAYSRGRTRVGWFHCFGSDTSARMSSGRCVALDQVSSGVTPPMLFPGNVRLYSRGQLRTGSSGGGTW